MNSETLAPQVQSWPAGQVSPAQLASLSCVDFSECDTGEIFQSASAAVGLLSPCQVNASYRFVDGESDRFPPCQGERPDIERHLNELDCGGCVHAERGRWEWSLPLDHRGTVMGCLILSAAGAPSDTEILLLRILAQQAGAALAYVAVRERDNGFEEQPATSRARAGRNRTRDLPRRWSCQQCPTPSTATLSPRQPAWAVDDDGR
jgi:hypothetical protein